MEYIKVLLLSCMFGFLVGNITNMSSRVLTIHYDLMRIEQVLRDGNNAGR